MTKTFVSKSGNVALARVEGRRGRLDVIDVMWDKPASKKDIRECNAWFAKENPQYAGILATQINDATERRQFIDGVLFGGQRN